MDRVSTYNGPKASRFSNESYKNSLRFYTFSFPESMYIILETKQVCRYLCALLDTLENWRLSGMENVVLR